MSHVNFLCAHIVSIQFSGADLSGHGSTCLVVIVSPVTAYVSLTSTQYFRRCLPCKEALVVCKHLSRLFYTPYLLMSQHMPPNVTS